MEPYFWQGEFVKLLGSAVKLGKPGNGLLYIVRKPEHVDSWVLVLLQASFSTTRMT